MPRKGMITADNDTFLRAVVRSISIATFKFGRSSREEAHMLKQSGSRTIKVANFGNGMGIMNYCCKLGE